MNITIADADEHSLLQEAQMEIFARLIPVIVVMSVFGFLGFIGNVLTITFYVGNMKRSPSAVQIACLAATDLVVCVMIIPNNIEMVYNVAYDQSILCKLTHVIGYWSICSSSLILFVIAIDRHKRICRPHSEQITIKKTGMIIAVISSGSFVLSLRNFVNMDATEVKVKTRHSNVTVTGHYCTTREDGGFKISTSVFYGIDVLLVLTCWITLIVTYSLIIHTLFKVKRTHKASSRLGRDGPQVVPGEAEYSTDTLDSRGNSSAASNAHRLEISNTEVSGSSFADVNQFQYTGQCTGQNTLQVPEVTYSAKTLPPPQRSPKLGRTQAVCAKTLPKPSRSESTPDILKHMVNTMVKGKKRRQRKIAARSRHERSLTFMMLTVSMLFILCMVPYFVIRVLMRLVLDSGKEYELGTGRQFALRLVYLNSVFNPMVYCFFNPKFRTYLRDVLYRCFHCRNKESEEKDD